MSHLSGPMHRGAGCLYIYITCTGRSCSNCRYVRTNRRGSATLLARPCTRSEFAHTTTFIVAARNLRVLEHHWQWADSNFCVWASIHTPNLIERCHLLGHRPFWEAPASEDWCMFTKLRDNHNEHSLYCLISLSVLWTSLTFLSRYLCIFARNVI